MGKKQEEEVVVQQQEAPLPPPPQYQQQQPQYAYHVPPNAGPAPCSHVWLPVLRQAKKFEQELWIVCQECGDAKKRS